MRCLRSAGRTGRAERGIEKAREPQAGDAELAIEHRQDVAQIAVVEHVVGRPQILHHVRLLMGLLGPFAQRVGVRPREVDGGILGLRFR
jgi:hypothetical protein